VITLILDLHSSGSWSSDGLQERCHSSRQDLCVGFVDGLSGVVMKPYQGTQTGGMKAAAKGLGKGLMNLTTKTGAGMFGLMGYTSAGMAKSLRTAVYSKTRKSIAAATHAEGEWLVGQSSYGIEEAATITSRFEALRKK
jgi:hypothetical protein